ncbi:MAG: class I SAM-dependent methyltransferase, partial [Thermomicrobiales bacterium]
YEIENESADPDGVIERAMARIAPWDGKVVLDLGAGTGFHLPRFADRAAHVIAIEPDGHLRLRLMQRLIDRQLTNVSVIGASAADIPLRDDAVDIVHARFAYFFGPGCEPGLRELERIVAPGGTVFIIDNDLRSGTFASWVRSSYDGYAPEEIDRIEQFWRDEGFTLERLASRWLLPSREAFERIIRLEFPPDHAGRIIAAHDGLEVDYHLLLLHRTV